MNQRKMRTCVSTSVLMFIVCASLAQAQLLTRTWVSGVGDDTNSCSRTAPCRTFAGAFARTQAGGEISVLDPGSFGTITINKSVTISGDGTLASLLAAGTNGVVVNAGANDVVILRGLSINGLGTGLSGVRFLAGGALHIQDCDIYGFNASPALGINFEPSATSRLFVENTTLRNNGDFATNVGGGVRIQSGVSGAASVSMRDVTVDRNVTGIRVNDSSSVFIRDSVVAGNSQNGLLVESTGGGSVTAFLDHASLAGNGLAGLQSTGTGAVARITDTTISGNTTGLQATLSGQIVSFGTNNNDGNGTNGAPTSTVAQQ